MAEISKEYGTALFMLACEKNETKNYADALQKVSGVFGENPDYLLFLASPSISLSERLAAIGDAFGGRVPEDVVSYLKLLCEKGRISCFSESVEEYNRLLSASEQVARAKVTSVVPLSDTEKDKLIEKLKAICKCDITAEYLIDESLLGGVVVELDGKILDGSLRSRMRDMKEVISK